jgi:SAM-dependent methyltransferase
MTTKDVATWNRDAWDRRVAQGDRWTVPFDPKTIDEARNGSFSILLTPTIPVPMSWFGEISGSDVLCLASGGGQQAPVLAAVGASVTVLDNSPAQLKQDAMVAEREELSIRLEHGLMQDLARFGDQSFDLVFHPCSNSYVANILPTWSEAHRVLRPKGTLLSGFANPLRYLFDQEAEERGELRITHTIPYSDVEALSTEGLQRLTETGDGVEFGHSLNDQIGGQIDAGFSITGFYEDRFLGNPNSIDAYIATFIATRAVKGRP